MNGTDVLASKLVELIDIAKAASPKVWEVYLHQARLDVFIMIAQIVIGHAILVTLFIRSIRIKDDSEFSDLARVVTGTILFVTVFITIAGGIPHIVTGLANPAYRAIQLMLGGVQ